MNTKTRKKNREIRELSPNTRALPVRHLDFGVEALESRQLLAGNVTAVITDFGNLLIVGDSADNVVQVDVDGFGNVEVTGHEGTHVNSTNLSSSQLSGDIRIALFGGDDSLVLDGPGDHVPVNNISILTGTGDDAAIVSNMSEIAGSVGIFTGSGDDQAAIKYSSAGGNMTISSGSGDDTNTIANANAANLTMLTGTGNDSDTIYYSVATNNVTIISTAGDDVVDIESVISSNLSISTGSGDDQLEMTDVHTKYNAVVATGGGADSVIISHSTVSGDLYVNTGSGNDELAMKYVDAGAEGRTSIRTGSGNDQVAIGESDFGSSATLFLAGGSDELSVAGAVNGAGLLSGGVGTDRIENADLLGGLNLFSFESYT